MTGISPVKLMVAMDLLQFLLHMCIFPFQYGNALLFLQRTNLRILWFSDSVHLTPLFAVARTQKDKDRLSNMMAYGEDIAPPSSASLQAAREKMWREQLQQLDEPDHGMDRFDECKLVLDICVFLGL